MKILVPALLALLAAPAALVPVSPAVAQASADCQAQIASLRAASSTVAISGKNADQDRASLLKTLDAASNELSKGKNADAAHKLGDYKVKVQQLADAGRISSTDAAALLTQADAAIACINGLTTAADAAAVGTRARAATLGRAIWTTRASTSGGRSTRAGAE